MDCELTGTAVAGQYANIGSVTGTDAAGETVGDTDPSHYVGLAVGSISILKLVDNLDGGWVPNAVYPNPVTDVTWQITVTNEGTSVLFNVTLQDTNAAACEAAFAAAATDKGWSVNDTYYLPAGEGLTFECSSTVGANAPAINTAVATGFDLLQRQVGPVESSAFITRVAASATIGDTVWYDTDDDGVQDAGELGIEGAKVTLTGLDGQDVDPDTDGVQTTLSKVTNVDGKYLFSGLYEGNYRVQVLISDVPDPQDRTLRFTTASSYTILLPDSGERLDADFGVIADTLPETGISTDQILTVAMLLIATGLLGLAVSRRREDELGTDVAA
jgi:LPXTG-motif cell wall-anchored protein